MILVTVGTHGDPFERLVAAAERLARESSEEVVVQAGPATTPTPSCARVDVVGPDALAALIGRARVVLLHAGPSTLAEVVAAGAIPLVIPRDPAFGEHVDGHQLRWVRELPPEIVAWSPDEAVRRVLTGALPATPPARLAPDAARTADFCRALDALLQDIRSQRVSRRGSLRAILSPSLGRRSRQRP